MQRRLSALMIAGIITILDQITKMLVSRFHPNFKVIPGFFNIHYVENTGAAFGILQDQQTLLIIVSVLALGVLGFLIVSDREGKSGVLYGLGLILGGTCGNLVDRARLRYVVDFLQFHIKQYYWPSFNVADSAITIGVAILVIMTLSQERKSEETS
jgi:signal peptidase II